MDFKDADRLKEKEVPGNTKQKKGAVFILIVYKVNSHRVACDGDRLEGLFSLCCAHLKGLLSPCCVHLTPECQNR